MARMAMKSFPIPGKLDGGGDVANRPPLILRVSNVIDRELEGATVPYSARHPGVRRAVLCLSGFAIDDGVVAYGPKAVLKRLLRKSRKGIVTSMASVFELGDLQSKMR